VKNNDVQGLSGDGVSNILPLSSNLFTKKRISFAKMACEFIEVHNISNENKKG
jgi:hypothetical protein